jgi:hypothetical protein
MSKRKQQRARSSGADPSTYSLTEVGRRYAVFLLPGTCLFHALAVYGISSTAAKWSALAAIPAFLAGFSMRWMRAALPLFWVTFALVLLLVPYSAGVLGPLAYLIVSESEWNRPLTAVVLSAGYGAVLTWRFRVSLREDWSGPLETGPGVVLDPHSGILDRTSHGTDNVYTWICLVPLIAFLLTIPFFSKGSSGYLLLALGVGPIAISVTVMDGIARSLTFIWVFRRWEHEHGIRLRLPPLQRRSRRTRRAKAIGASRRRSTG